MGSASVGHLAGEGIKSMQSMKSKKWNGGGDDGGEMAKARSDMTGNRKNIREVFGVLT